MQRDRLRGEDVAQIGRRTGEIEHGERERDAAERVAEQRDELSGEEQPKRALAEGAERVPAAGQRFLPGLSRPFGSKTCLIRRCRS